ncbi:MAG: hypothetical protein AAF717_22685 [Bacteroidota bacterium]
MKYRVHDISGLTDDQLDTYAHKIGQKLKSFGGFPNSYSTFSNLTSTVIELDQLYIEYYKRFGKYFTELVDILGAQSNPEMN